MKFAHLLGLAFISSALSQVTIRSTAVINNQKCFDVSGGVLANGSLVQINDCTSNSTQRWIVNAGASTLQVAGTNFCLDATAPAPSVGTPMRIWQCSGIAQQRWVTTVWSSGAWFQLSSQDRCLDLRGGSTANRNPIQAFTCVDTPNQRWELWPA